MNKLSFRLRALAFAMPLAVATLICHPLSVRTEPSNWRSPDIRDFTQTIAKRPPPPKTDTPTTSSTPGGTRNPEASCKTTQTELTVINHHQGKDQISSSQKDSLA